MTTLYTGRDAGLYIGVGEATSPISLVRDATIDMPTEMIDGNYKGAGYANVVLPGKQSGSISFDVVNDPDDVAIQILVAAKAARTMLYWRTTSDGTGQMVASGTCYVEGASWSQPLDGVQTISFTLTTTGAITFTAS